jgi:hypothetical protein
MTEVQKMLKHWMDLLDEGQVNAVARARRMKHGLQTKVRDTAERPYVLDHKFDSSQRKMQQALERAMPQYKHIIWSTPATGGFEWKVGDYIELYFDHYRIVIQKLGEMTL